jgi:nickel transport protein
MNPRLNPYVPYVVSVFFFLLNPAAPAHRLNVFAYPQGEEIRVESYFSRGSECKNCPVEVLNAAGEAIASGTTDKEGKWSFKPEGREAVKIVVSAGEGHRGEYALLEADFPGAESPTEPPDSNSPESDWEVEVAEPSHSHAHDESVPHTHGPPPLEAREVEGIVERVLERKLGPIRRELEKAQIDEPGIQEILGGIGYIFGLFGVGAYFLSRSNRKT